MSFKSSAILVACCTSALAADRTAFEIVEAPRGVVVSRSKAVIGSELVARIAKIPFKDGERFKAGDTLLEFDCRRYAAELAAARAEEQAMMLGVKENRELRRHKAVGLNELEISEAKLAQAKAQAMALEIRMSQCVIAAPFSGRIVEKVVNEFEIPRANEPLLRIVDDRNLEIELIVPSKWLSWLRNGDSFMFDLDETRKMYKARIRTINAEVDPVSQTIRVKGEFKELPEDVLPGMSGTALFEKMSSLADGQKSNG